MAVHQVYLYNLSNLASYSGGSVRDFMDNGSVGAGIGAVGETVTFSDNAGQAFMVSDGDGSFDQTDGDQVTSGSHAVQGWASSFGTSIGNYNVPSGSRTDVEYGYELTPSGGGETIWVYAVATNYPTLMDTNGFTATGHIDPSKTYTVTGYDSFPDPLYSTMVVCFGAGTMILTPRGEVAIEQITIGDLMITADHGPQPVLWIGRRKLDRAMLAAMPELAPIRIRRGALGPGSPRRDLLLSKHHRLAMRFAKDESEVLLPAFALLEMSRVELAEDLAEVQYFHLLFEAHEIVFANGSRAESLYAGRMALKALAPPDRSSVLALLPPMGPDGPRPARPLVPMRAARKMVADALFVS